MSDCIYMLAYGRPHPAESATTVGAFSSYDLAKAYAEEKKLDNWEIEEWEVDKLVTVSNPRIEYEGDNLDE